MARRHELVAKPGLVLALVLLLGFGGIARAQESEPDAACQPTQNRSFLKCSKIPDVAGLYNGTLVDALSGPGTIALNIQQDGKKITGFWNTFYPNNTTAGGPLTGTVSKTAIRAKLTTDYNRCFYHVVVSIRPDEFRGTFVTTRGCPEEDSGSFTIPRN